MACAHGWTAECILCLRTQVAALTEERDTANDERAAALTVHTKEGLLASEWLLRTGLAERRAEAAEARVKALEEALRAEWLWCGNCDMPILNDQSALEYEVIGCCNCLHWQHDKTDPRDPACRLYDGPGKTIRNLLAGRPPTKPMTWAEIEAACAVKKEEKP